MPSIGISGSATHGPDSLAGCWIGEYAYVPRTDVSGIPSPCPFRLEIRSGWLGFFSGSVQDNPESGIGMAGRIRGWSGGSKIHFVKRMPVRVWRPVDHESKQVGELMQNPRRRHPMIFYSGSWIAQENEFRGRWRFLSPLRVPGTWFARQVG